jgi:2,5-diketo-D-gluconate reductase A
MTQIPAVDLDGIEMPMVGLGTWQLRGRQARDAIGYALEIGYRHVDTATMYRNEDEVGAAIRSSGVVRESVFITTKLPPERAGRERETLEASLKALGFSYVDLWLIHWPPRGQASVPVWSAMLELRDEGLCRAVGVSNYSVRQIDELIASSGVRPAVNQVPWSPSQYDAAFLEAMRSRGVALEGYSPLKGTRLSDPLLASLAGKYGVTPAQIVLRWHLEHRITVIPKSARRERILENLAITGFSLTPEEVARLDDL